jgi:hypothetical protein
MPQFRCYLLNAADKIVSVDSVEAGDVGGAMILADYLIRKKIFGICGNRDLARR